MRLVLATLAIGAIVATTPASAIPVYYALQTNITGANTQLDQDHTSTWSFLTGISWNFGGGAFVIKDGPASFAVVTLSVY